VEGQGHEAQGAALGAGGGPDPLHIETGEILVPLLHLLQAGVGGIGAHQPDRRRPSPRRSKADQQHAEQQGGQPAELTLGDVRDSRRGDGTLDGTDVTP
jgi:hypothetical protein